MSELTARPCRPRAGRGRPGSNYAVSPVADFGASVRPGGSRCGRGSNLSALNAASQPSPVLCEPLCENSRLVFANEETWPSPVADWEPSLLGRPLAALLGPSQCPLRPIARPSGWALRALPNHNFRHFGYQSCLSRLGSPIPSCVELSPPGPQCKSQETGTLRLHSLLQGDLSWPPGEPAVPREVDGLLGNS